MFQGAELDAYSFGWNITPLISPDEELKWKNSHQELIRRSRQLRRDNMIIAGMEQVYINMIVGRGPTVYSASDNKIQRRQINTMLEENLANCDITGTRSLNCVLEALVSCAFIDGDLLVHFPYDDEREMTVVELIEAHRIQTPSRFQKEEDKQYVRNGAKYDKKGHLLGFYVKKAECVDKSSSQVGGNEDDFVFIPTWKESNGFKRRVSCYFPAPLNMRPLASRQYPPCTPVITEVKNMADYEQAIIVGARVAACYAAFIETQNPAGAQKSMASETKTDVMSDGKVHTRLQPGMVMYLKMGEKVSFSNPNKPSDNHDDFILRKHKAISMYFRVPYIIAFLDTEQTSYSSWRGAVLESYKMVNRWRRQANEVIDILTNIWVLEGMANETIRGSNGDAKIRKRWPSQGNLDLEKEARGNSLRLENETVSRQMICDEDGTDYEEVKDDLLQEALDKVDREAEVLKRRKEKEEEYGIEFTPEKESQQRETYRREGEDEDLSDEDKKERRKKDGNW